MGNPAVAQAGLPVHYWREAGLVVRNARLSDGVTRSKAA
jgi:hypothetical protein